MCVCVNVWLYECVCEVISAFVLLCVHASVCACVFEGMYECV